MTSLGLAFGKSMAQPPPGLLDLRRFIDPNAPAYSTEKESHYRQSFQKSRAESEFDENKQTIFVPDDDERVSRMPTEEDVMEFDTEIAFDDDSAWDAVPRSHRRGRFTQYRNLARAKLAQEAEQSKQRADRKILQLKSRFNEFKAQWDEERQGLELSVQEAERETEDAKRKAELAVRKLEELYERFKDTQSLSTADSSELHSRIGQLQVDKTQLETRVEELEHELRVINQLLKKAAKDKEEAEKKLAAASAHEQPASRGDGEEQFEESMTAGIQSDEEGSSVDIPFPDDAGGDGNRLSAGKRPILQQQRQPNQQQSKQQNPALPNQTTSNSQFNPVPIDPSNRGIAPQQQQQQQVQQLQAQSSLRLPPTAISRQKQRDSTLTLTSEQDTSETANILKVSFAEDIGETVETIVVPEQSRLRNQQVQNVQRQMSYLQTPHATTESKIDPVHRDSNSSTDVHPSQQMHSSSQDQVAQSSATAVLVRPNQPIKESSAQVTQADSAVSISSPSQPTQVLLESHTDTKLISSNQEQPIVESSQSSVSKMHQQVAVKSKPAPTKPTRVARPKATSERGPAESGTIVESDFRY